MKSKCLIIANDIGFSAPGVVYETILTELSQIYEIKIIVPQIKKNCLPSNVKIINSIPIGINKYRITLYSFLLFGYNVFDKIWVRRQLDRMNHIEIIDTDIIISFVSNEHYKSLLLGYELSKRHHKKWIVYSVDAVPAPIRWTNDKSYYNRTIKFFNKYIENSDALFSSNKQMLKYQLSNYSDYKGLTGIVYTPIRSNVLNSLGDNTGTPIILYTGNIYGPRKISTVLDGFRLLLKDYPTAKLIFVGVKRINGKIKNHLDLISNGNIEFHNYTSDLTSYYKVATVLLDINAYFDNDVFLSSKIINYLPFYKPIVSITGLGSPCRKTFTEDSSIIHSTHDPKEIYVAFHKAISLKEINKEERSQYIKMFEVKNCIKDLVSTISYILSNK